MVKFYEQTHTHAYPFETVTLGWFLRYPNPFSTHVISTDTISRHYDPKTQRLYTARLHLKSSKIPAPILKLLPSSLLGNSANGESQSYILERSVVDMKEGVMLSESRNLELTNVLMVMERQCYRRPTVDMAQYFRKYAPIAGFNFFPTSAITSVVDRARSRSAEEAQTDVTTRVELLSRFGQVRARMLANRQAQKAAETSDEEAPVKAGFLTRWGQGSVQRTIEAIGLRRAERAIPKSKEGMNVVLERLRGGGLVAVLEGMKMDRAQVLAEQ